MIIRIDGRVSLLNLGKAAAFVFFLYMAWYSETWGNALWLLYGSAFLLTAFVVMDATSGGRIRLGDMPAILKAYFIFAIYSFLSGIFVAYDISYMLSSLLTFVAFSVVCFDCWYISYETGGMDWILKMLVICALVCSIQAGLFGVPFRNGSVYVTTMSLENNPNTLGFCLLIGMMALVADLRRFDRHMFVNMFFLLLMAYVIIQTGSRKCIIAMVILLLFWLCFYLRDLKRTEQSGRALIALLIVLVSAFIAMYYLIRYFNQSSAYSRLVALFSEEGTMTRRTLYAVAISLWKSSPVFGIGYNHYRLLSGFGYYSHSTYAEILSCTGLVGILIFFFPFFPAIAKVARGAFRRGADPEIRYRYSICGVMLLVELFMGVGQIFIYDFFHMLILLFIFYEIKRLGEEA